MTLPTRLIGTVAVVATTASLAIPGVAGARAGDRSFQQTFPVASQLCAKLAAGKASKHLQHFAPQILANCAALQNAFTAAQSTVLTARASIESAIAADHAAIAAACPPPVAGRPACIQTRHTQDLAIHALRHQRVRAAHVYFRTIEKDRHVFWRAIRALPGESHVHADTPIAEQND